MEQKAKTNRLALHWGLSFLLAPILLYFVVGAPVEYTLLFVIYADSFTTLLISAFIARNLGFFMALVVLVLRSRTKGIFTNREIWYSAWSNKKVALLLLVAYAYNLVAVLLDSIWVSPIMIPILINLFWSYDLYEHINMNLVADKSK